MKPMFVRRLVTQSIGFIPYVSMQVGYIEYVTQTCTVHKVENRSKLDLDIAVWYLAMAPM